MFSIYTVRHLTLLVLFFFFAFFAHAEELRTSFVQGVWYAHIPPLAGEATRMYVALRNNSPYDLTGTIRFTDNGERIGSAYVSALPGRIVEAWVDWTPRYGEHKIEARLTNVQVHEIGKTPKTEESSDIVAADTLFIDYDTDNDGILNEQDEDDDNDGMSDADERAAKRNPLKADPKPRATSTPDTTQVSTTTTFSIPEPEPAALALAGLETYLPEGVTRSLLEATTDQISETKASLDAYRKERSDALKEYFSYSTATPVTTAGDMATITRSTVEKDEGFFEAAVRGGKALVQGGYTIVLAIASQMLAYPALLELLFLLLVLYMIYRSARRFGRRRNN